VTEASTWKPCSACKKPIAHGALYYVCNVSTCNRARTALRFCTVSCWEVHLPVARHRESWAEERKAPSPAEAARLAAAESGANPGAARPARPVDAARSRPDPRQDPKARSEGPRGSSMTTPGRSSSSTAVPDEVLIVGSRLKDYVRALSGFNTSDRVFDVLSDHVRKIVERAIDNARADGRKTVLDRDVPKVSDR
jgi:hypothetical protein